MTRAEAQPVAAVDGLEAWMDAHSIGQGRLHDVVLLTGGTQNVLVRFRRGEREYVLRRPAEGAFDQRIIAKEGLVLQALAQTDVAHPRLIAHEPDAEVVGYPFLLMQPIDGEVATQGWPTGFADIPGALHTVGTSAVRILAELSRVDPDAVGLSLLRRPGDFLERQVSRWRWQLSQYDEIPGYVPLPAEPITSVERWLERARPAAGMPAIVHGDAHLGNVMFRGSDGEALALIDWELATVGDPLLDLAEFLVCWPGPAGGGPYTKVLPLTPTAGLADEDELIHLYAAVSGRDVSRMTWYKVLAAYRLAVLLEGSLARARAGRGNEDTGHLLHAVAVELLDWAAAQIEERAR